MEDIASIRERRWSLQGATALVTGGTKGIGCILLTLYVFVSHTHSYSRILYLYVIWLIDEGEDEHMQGAFVCDSDS